MLKYIGCSIEPQELWKVYNDNEVVADEDYSGRLVLITIKVKKGLKKDMMGVPYLDYGLKDYSLNGLRFNFKSDDPTLRKIKVGQTLTIQAVPKKFIMSNVILDVINVVFQDEMKK